MSTALRREPDVLSSRAPQQLLLALFGELLRRGVHAPQRAGFFLDVLEGAGIAGPTARAALDRMVLRGLLTRARVGRGVEYGLTDHARTVLGKASERVHSPHPFDPVGQGWTLVTFTVPEGQRALRHRLRAALTWEGFASLRDGLWLAPGEVDLSAALESLRPDLPTASVVAFRAHDLEDFPVSSAHGLWDLDALRDAHEAFLGVWEDAGSAAAAPPLSVLTMLVADWLALLRSDPRLPPELLGQKWPSQRSIRAYRAQRDYWAQASASALDASA